MNGWLILALVAMAFVVGAVYGYYSSRQDEEDDDVR